MSGPAPGVSFEMFLASGDVNITMTPAASQLAAIDVGVPMVMLAGVHVGCFELFGTDRIRTIRDLKGKTVAVPGTRTAPHLILSIMTAYVGVDPRRDINWVEHTDQESIGLLAAVRLTPSWAFRRRRKSSGPGKSGTGSSTREPTSRGLSTSAAWSLRLESSSANTRWPRNEHCAPS